MTPPHAKASGGKDERKETRMKAKLNKWYPLRSRFRVVKARIKDDERDIARQYRLIIEFPREYRVGWFPFELQLRDGERSLTNYWCNPFGESEILAVIDAVHSIVIQQHQLAKLEIVKARHGRRHFKMVIENLHSKRALENSTTEQGGKKA